jgi:hypothetical protein
MANLSSITVRTTWSRRIRGAEDFAESGVVFHKHYSLGDGQKELARQYAEKGLALLNSHAAPASSWSGTEQRRGEIREDLQRVLKKLDQTEK